MCAVWAITLTSIRVLRVSHGQPTQGAGSPQVAATGRCRARGGGMRSGRRPRPCTTCRTRRAGARSGRSEEHTSELQSRENLVCRLLLEKKKNRNKYRTKSGAYYKQNNSQLKSYHYSDI